jgi:predicted methyltransferase
MREKKRLIEALHKVVEDIMDNYDKYSENEINEIKKFYNNAIALNDKLEHYDQKKSVIDKLKEAFVNFFGGKNK